MTLEVTEWLSDTEQALWRRLLAVQRRMREKLDRDLQEGHGLSFGDYDVLVHLAEAPGQSLRMSDLADRLLLSRSGLTRRVDGLVRHGLVARRACPADGRGLLAELTETGAEALQTAAPTHVAGVRRYLIDPIGAPEGLSEGLARIERALDRG